MSRPLWAPDDVDLTRPSPSRIYDYLLGGGHNFAVDRELASKLLAADPRSAWYAQVNRAFLTRAVQFTLDEGVRQFLDVGSGIPTVGNVHEAAQALVPESRVVYVDVDPVAVAHSREILAANGRCGVVHADLRRPTEILAAPVVRELVDFSQPVAVLLLAVLHFVTDDEDPAGIVAQFRDVLAPGSFLAISHAAPAPRDPTSRGVLARDTYQQGATVLSLRTQDQVAALFAGFEMVVPGVVEIGSWRPDASAEPSDPVPGFAGVGVKA